MIVLDLTPDARDHHIVGERWNRTIGQPLVTAIVSLGRFGEHLDDQLWVHERPGPRIDQPWFEARDEDVGIEILTGRFHIYTLVTADDMARPVTERGGQLAPQVLGDLIVFELGE